MVLLTYTATYIRLHAQLTVPENHDTYRLTINKRPPTAWCRRSRHWRSSERKDIFKLPVSIGHTESTRVAHMREMEKEWILQWHNEYTD